MTISISIIPRSLAKLKKAKITGSDGKVKGEFTN